MTTEFNNKINLGAIPSAPVQKVTEKNAAPVEKNEVKDVNSQEVPVGQNAVAGKSQIKADNIANDLVTFKSNPKAVEMADRIFDKTYASLVAEKDPEAYEKACLVASQFVRECLEK